MIPAESHRISAIDILAEVFERAGVPLAKLKAVEFVDHMNAHSVETMDDLEKAKSGKKR